MLAGADAQAAAAVAIGIGREADALAGDAAAGHQGPIEIHIGGAAQVDAAEGLRGAQGAGGVHVNTGAAAVSAGAAAAQGQSRVAQAAIELEAAAGGGHPFQIEPFVGVEGEAGASAGGIDAAAHQHVFNRAQAQGAVGPQAGDGAGHHQPVAARMAGQVVAGAGRGDGSHHRRLVEEGIAGLILQRRIAVGEVDRIAIGLVVVTLAARADRQRAAGRHRAPQQHLGAGVQAQAGVGTADLGHRRGAVHAEVDPGADGRAGVDRQGIAAAEADAAAGAQRP